MGGPFNPTITPVQSRVHYDDLTDTWHVTVSRQIEVGDGVKREISRQNFATYAEALTFISVFWGNA